MEILFWVPVIAIIIFSVVLHEIAHGYAAYRLGDNTAASAGRLTLNPIAHIDPMMTIAVPIFLLWSTGGQFAFGGAKPVPINPFNFRNPRKGMMWTGLAGPATNIALAVGMAALLVAASLLRKAVSTEISLAEVILVKGIFFNILLACFNLIPIPPLDGSRLLAGVVSAETARKLDALEPYGIFIVVGLIFFVPGFDRLLFTVVFTATQVLTYPAL